MAEQGFPKRIKVAVTKLLLSTNHSTSKVVMACFVQVFCKDAEPQGLWILLDPTQTTLEIPFDLPTTGSLGLTDSQDPDKPVSATITVSVFFWRCKSDVEVQFVQENYANLDHTVILNAYNEQQRAIAEAQQTTWLGAARALLPDLANHRLTCTPLSRSFNLTEENGDFKLSSLFDVQVGIQYGHRGPLDAAQLVHGISIDLEASYGGTVAMSRVWTPTIYAVIARVRMQVFRSHAQNSP